ncbi:MAG: hypothetical protein ACQEUM_07080 [Pseudomonadota bacterium]
MSISRLKSIEQEARTMNAQSKKHQIASKSLAEMRNSPTGIWSQMDVMRHWSHGSDEIAKKAVAEVWDELKIDIYRIAEMRLQAKARELKVKAAQREAVIQSCILPLPEMEES